MNGVIYARYSSDNQREESIEGQLRECQAFAEKNDIMILNTYIDRAFSAKTDNRPEFQHMIADSKKKMFDVVLVCKKISGSSIERSTWLSAAKLITASGFSSSKRRNTPSLSQISSLTKRKFGLSHTLFSVLRFPA